MPKQCLFFWNTHEADGGGNLTLQAGPTPSTAILRMRLGYNNLQFGTLILTDSESQATRLTGCRVARAVITQGGGGGRWRELTIEDRRWTWQGGYSAVYGEYNIDQAGLTTVRKSVRELATICFQALNEVGYDVSVLPHDIYPPVTWDGTEPGAALQALCDDFNCLIVPTLYDTFRIVRDGQGVQPRPDPRQMDFTSGLEPPVIPKAIICEGGETHVQHDLPLEAVGLEITGTNKGKFVPVDQLSYKPTSWDKIDPTQDKAFGAITSLEARKVARKWLWRRYRIKGPFQLPLPPAALSTAIVGGRLNINARMDIANYFKIVRGKEWRVLPLRDTQLNLDATKDLDGRDAEVWGYFYLRDAANKNVLGYTQVATLPDEATNPNKLITGSLPTPAALAPLQYLKSFEIDPDSGHVIFEDPVYFKDLVAQSFVEAVIRLRTSMVIKDTESAARICQQYRAPLQSSRNTANVIRFIKEPEIALEYCSLSPTGGDPFADRNVFSNADSFVLQAQNYINNERLKLSIGIGYSTPCKGFVFDINLDGVVRTITFDVSDEGEGTTHIDYNMERPEAYLTLNELRARRMATFRLAKQAYDAKQANRRIVATRSGAPHGAQ